MQKTDKPISIEPIVSIIIPTFNQHPDYLRAALQSAKLQTYPCEIIVIDDGSHPPQDGIVAEVLQGYSDLHGHKVMAKYQYQDNRGVAGALNRGLEESTGDFIQWLPSDDLFHLDKTRIQLAEMLANPLDMVSYCAYQEGIPATTVTWPSAQYPSREKLLSELAKHCFINAATVMWRREVFDAVGGFDEAHSHCQDYEMLLRCAGVSNFLAVNEPLVRRRVHEGQMLQTLKDPEQAEIKRKEMEALHDKYGVTGNVWLPHGAEVQEVPEDDADTSVHAEQAV